MGRLLRHPQNRSLHGASPTSGIHLAAAVTCGGTVSEAGACDHSPNAFGSARTVAGAGSGGQIKTSGLRDIHRPAVRFASRHAIGIAEPAGLNILGCGGDGGHGRTAGRKDICLYQLPRNHRHRSAEEQPFWGLRFRWWGQLVHPQGEASVGPQVAAAEGHPATGFRCALPG